MKNDLKKYGLPALLGVAGALLGVAAQVKTDKTTEKMVRDATYDEFNRLARSKHGGPRHPGNGTL